MNPQTTNVRSPPQISFYPLAPQTKHCEAYTPKLKNKNENSKPGVGIQIEADKEIQEIPTKNLMRKPFFWGPVRLDVQGLPQVPQLDLGGGGLFRVVRVLA